MRVVSMRSPVEAKWDHLSPCPKRGDEKPIHLSNSPCALVNTGKEQADSDVERKPTLRLPEFRDFRRVLCCFPRFRSWSTAFEKISRREWSANRRTNRVAHPSG